MSSWLFVVLTLCLSFIICLTFSLGKRWMLIPMLAGFLTRLVFLLLDYNNIFTPPGGGADAVSFTRKAQEWSMHDWPGVFATFNYSASYVYSTFGAILYKLVGFHELI